MSPGALIVKSHLHSPRRERSRVGRDKREPRRVRRLSDLLAFRKIAPIMRMTFSWARIAIVALLLPTTLNRIRQGNRPITTLQINNLQTPSFYELERGFLRSPNKAINFGSDDAQRALDNDTLKGHIHADDLRHLSTIPL